MSAKKSKTYTAAEVQTEAQDFVQKSVDQAQVAYEKASAASHDGAQVLESLASAYKVGAVDFQNKAMEFTKANMEQAFDFSRKLFATREFGDIISLQQSFLKNQSEAFKTQATELGEIALRVSTETAKPLQESFSKSLNGFTKSFAA